MRFEKIVLLAAVIGSWFCATSAAQSDVQARQKETETEPSQSNSMLPPISASKTVLSLSQQGGLWIDLTRKWVIVDGAICLRDGPLEMFACPPQTKEHESVISLSVSARLVHAALLAVGAKTGTPVQFDPSYKRATGAVIDIVLVWKDTDGVLHTSIAQNWVRKGNSKKTMEYAWVFGGSGFWKDPSTGKKHYYGDDGSLVCLSNFPTATLDLPVESTKNNAALTYFANTPKIPPLKTPVRMILLERKDVDVKRIPRALIKSEKLLEAIQLWAKSQEENGK